MHARFRVNPDQVTLTANKIKKKSLSTTIGN